MARPCPNIFSEVPSLRRRAFVGEKAQKSTVFVEGKRAEAEKGIKKACFCKRLGGLGALTMGWCGRLSS